MLLPRAMLSLISNAFGLLNRPRRSERGGSEQVENWLRKTAHECFLALSAAYLKTFLNRAAAFRFLMSCVFSKYRRRLTCVQVGVVSDSSVGAQRRASKRRLPQLL